VDSTGGRGYWGLVCLIRYCSYGTLLYEALGSRPVRVATWLYEISLVLKISLFYLFQFVAFCIETQPINHAILANPKTSDKFNPIAASDNILILNYLWLVAGFQILYVTILSHSPTGFSRKYNPWNAIVISILNEEVAISISILLRKR
jgi:hypothetical protein